MGIKRSEFNGCGVVVRDLWVIWMFFIVEGYRIICLYGYRIYR